MRFIIQLFILWIVTSACQKQNQVEKKSDIVENIEEKSVENMSAYDLQKLELAKLDRIRPDSLASIEDWWSFLAFEEESCLVGRQYSLVQKNEPYRKSTFYRKEWRDFVRGPRKELVSFLVLQLSDTTKSKIHTCPYKIATVGELALYSLQQVTGKMWYDISGFEKYSRKNSKNLEGNSQIWLQNILKDDKQRGKLANAYFSLQ